MPAQSVRTELVNGVQRIAEQTGRDIRLEVESVIVALLEQYGDAPAIRDYFASFGPGDLVAAVRDVWHRRFAQGLQLIYEPHAQTRVLCAFGSVVDLVYVLDQTALQKLEHWCLNHAVNSQLGLTPSLDPENSVNIPKDIVAALEKAFQSEGLKPAVQTHELRGALRSKHFPLQPHRRGLGGAPAIIAEALAQLGVEARVYSMYHSIEQARCFGPQYGTKWLNLSTGQPIYHQAHSSGQRSHPARYTYALAYSQGLRLGSVNIAAKNTDRSLLLVRPYYGAKPLRSSVVRVGTRNLPSQKPAGPLEWPSVAGFVTWRLGGKAQSQLQIDFVPPQVVSRLAQEHHYVTLNAPGVGQLQNPNDPLTAVLLEQIQHLSRAGTSLHLEISGGADPKKHTLAPVAKSLRGLVRSMGINHKELAQVAGITGYPSKGIAPIAGSRTPEIYQRYVQALRLAQTLHLERLYVHGTDVDLILRRGASQAALQQEVQADLFTKGAVIVSILLRNGHNPQTYPLPRALYHEGFGALVEFAWQLSHERHPSAVKQRKALFRQLVNDGYYLAAGRDEYSVAVVPVMWPEAVRLDPSINTTGAGDICSGFSLVYSGWR